MKQPRIISGLIEKLQEHHNNRPIYDVNKLYAGQIVMLHSISYKPENNATYKRHNRTTPIKKYAVFYKKNDSEYVHIKTGKPLKLVDVAEECEFAIEELHPFPITYFNPLSDNFNNLMFSKKQICDIETSKNLKYGVIPNAEHLFGV